MWIYNNLTHLLLSFTSHCWLLGLVLLLWTCGNSTVSNSKEAVWNFRKGWERQRQKRKASKCFVSFSASIFLPTVIVHSVTSSVSFCLVWEESIWWVCAPAALVIHANHHLISTQDRTRGRTSEVETKGQRRRSHILCYKFHFLTQLSTPIPPSHHPIILLSFLGISPISLLSTHHLPIKSSPWRKKCLCAWRRGALCRHLICYFHIRTCQQRTFVSLLIQSYLYACVRTSRWLPAAVWWFPAPWCRPTSAAASPQRSLRSHTLPCQPAANPNLSPLSPKIRDL